MNKKWLFIPMFALFCAFMLVGCGSSDRDHNGPLDPTTDVTFLFNLEKDAITNKTTVPTTVATFAITGLQNDTKIFPAKEDAFLATKDIASDDGQEQKVVVENVPMAVNTFVIQYLASDGKVVAETVINDVDLTEQGSEPIKVGHEEAPIVMSQMTITIAETATHPDDANAYTISLFDSTDAVIANTDVIPIDTLIPVVFDETALNTVKITVTWMKDEEILGITTISGDKVPAMEAGKAYEVVIEGDYTPFGPEGEDLVINLQNCFVLPTAPASPINVTVTNDGKDIDLTAEYNADGEYTLTIPGGSYENIAITSIVLKEGETAFEWLDYSAAITENNATLDVEENEFANGPYEDGKVMEVANPRQLNNIQNQLNVDDKTICGNYKQIKDIDFAGSCGPTLKVAEIGAGPAYTYDVDNADANARYCGDFENNLYGWQPIGGKYLINDVAEKVDFIGSYDGNGFKISNLIMERVNNAKGIVSRCGLFGQIKDSTLKNITLDKTCQFAASNTTGAICGGTYGTDCTIENCTSSALVSALHGFGGILGGTFTANTTTVKNCQVVGAQIIGIYNGPGSYYEQMSSNANFGGIVGDTDKGSSTISDCSCDATTKISLLGDDACMYTATEAGGIVGKVQAATVLTNCTNNATMFVTWASSGIVGGATKAITLDNCQFTGSLTQNGNQSKKQNYYRLGGVFGYTTQLPTFANGTNSTGVLTVYINQYNPMDKTVGGLIGLAGSTSGNTKTPLPEDDVKTALTGNVGTPSAVQGEYANKSLYCGDPAINSLD